MEIYRDVISTRVVGTWWICKKVEYTEVEVFSSDCIPFYSTYLKWRIF